MGAPRSSPRLKAHVSQAPGLESELPCPAREVVAASLAPRARRKGKGLDRVGADPRGSSWTLRNPRAC